MRLTIKKFHKEDIGSYSCISSNSLGKVEGISRLYSKFILFYIKVNIFIDYFNHIRFKYHHY
jgi:hypothetical protein